MVGAGLEKRRTAPDQSEGGVGDVADSKDGHEPTPIRAAAPPHQAMCHGCEPRSPAPPDGPCHLPRMPRPAGFGDRLMPERYVPESADGPGAAHPPVFRGARHRSAPSREGCPVAGGARRDRRRRGWARRGRAARGGSRPDRSGPRPGLHRGHPQLLHGGRWIARPGHRRRAGILGGGGSCRRSGSERRQGSPCGWRRRRFRGGAAHRATTLSSRGPWGSACSTMSR